MTTRYEGKIRCPYCYEETMFDYAGGMWDINYCNYCNKKFRVKQQFIAEKLKGD